MFGTSSFSTEVPRQRVVSQLRVTRTLLHELSAGSSLSLSRKINPIVHVLHIVPFPYPWTEGLIVYLLSSRRPVRPTMAIYKGKGLGF